MARGGGGLRALCATAQREASVVLVHAEPHRAGAALGLASLLVGVVLVQTGQAAQGPWAWLALLGVLAGMALHLGWKIPGPACRVDFARRRAEPLAHPGDAVQVDGTGWEIRVGPGEQRPQLAIRLRHAERGIALCLLEMPARRQAEIRQLGALADVLAQRLGVARVGTLS
jgi:hypothetical protein